MAQVQDNFAETLLVFRQSNAQTLAQFLTNYTPLLTEVGSSREIGKGQDPSSFACELC